MTTYRELIRNRPPGFRPPQARDRCHKCGYHVLKMGHPEGCPGDQREEAK